MRASEAEGYGDAPMSGYTIDTTEIAIRMANTGDNRGLRDRLDGRTTAGSTVLAELRLLMQERARSEATNATPTRRGRHRAHAR